MADESRMIWHDSGSGQTMMIDEEEMGSSVSLYFGLKQEKFLV